MNLWLPAPKYCRLHFLQQILTEEKTALYAAQVKYSKRIRDFLPEYAIKNVWPLVRTNAKLRKFLPAEEYDLGRFSDRYFFWGVLCTIQSEYAEAYIDDAMK